MAYGSDSRGLSTIDLEVSFVHYVFLSSLGVWLWVDVSVRGLAMHVEKRGSFGFLLQSKSLTTGGCENGHFCRCGGSYFASRLSDIARAIFALNTHFSEQSYRRSEAEKRPSFPTFARFFHLWRGMLQKSFEFLCMWVPTLPPSHLARSTINDYQCTTFSPSSLTKTWEKFWSLAR